MEEAPSTLYSLDQLAQIVIVMCAILVIVGSTGPWADVGDGRTVDGAANDSTLTIVLGTLAAAAGVSNILRPHPWWGTVSAFVLLAICAAIGLVEWLNVEDIVKHPPPDGSVEPAWGLYMMTLAAAAGATISAISTVSHRLRPERARRDTSEQFRRR